MFNVNGERETPKTFRERKKIERLNKWRDKALQGQIIRQTEEVRDESSWDWLQKGDLKKEREGLVTAA